MDFSYDIDKPSGEDPQSPEEPVKMTAHGPHEVEEASRLSVSSVEEVPVDSHVVLVQDEASGGDASASDPSEQKGNVDLGKVYKPPMTEDERDFVHEAHSGPRGVYGPISNALDYEDRLACAGERERVVTFLSHYRMHDVLQSLVNQAVSVRPRNPFQFLARRLAGIQLTQCPIDMVTVIGAPRSGKTVVASVIAHDYGYLHICPVELVQRKMENSSDSFVLSDIHPSVIADLIREEIQNHAANCRGGWATEATDDDERNLRTRLQRGFGVVLDGWPDNSRAYEYFEDHVCEAAYPRAIIMLKPSAEPSDDGKEEDEDPTKLYKSENVHQNRAFQLRVQKSGLYDTMVEQGKLFCLDTSKPLGEVLYALCETKIGLQPVALPDQQADNPQTQPEGPVQE